MTPKVKFALVGLTAAAGLAALFATTSTASAAPAGPAPKTPNNNWPSDNMPWMMYSATTLSLQRRYNQLAAANGLDRYPQITEDGILGPESCRAFSQITWLSSGELNPPLACSGRV